MSEQKKYGRPQYVGSCANLHKVIVLANDAKDTNNDEILAAARESRPRFYKDYFGVLTDIKKDASSRGR